MAATDPRVSPVGRLPVHESKQSRQGSAARFKRIIPVPKGFIEVTSVPSGYKAMIAVDRIISVVSGRDNCALVIDSFEKSPTVVVETYGEIKAKIIEAQS